MKANVKLRRTDGTALARTWPDTVCAGYALTVASRSAEVRAEELVIDIKMPEMDGIELLQRVKRIDSTTEVVMMTAYASPETVKNSVTHGAFEYLIKPFSRPDLEVTARRALAHRETVLGRRRRLSVLVDEMRSLTTKTLTVEEVALREQAELSLRVTQLSILREIFRGFLGHLDLVQLIAAVTVELRETLGYDEVSMHLGPTAPESPAASASIICSINDSAATLGYLAAANRSSGRPIEPRERELLEMLSEYLAVAIRNSRVHGEVAEAKQSLERLIQSAGDAIISLDVEGRIQGWNPPPEGVSGGYGLYLVSELAMRLQGALLASNIDPAGARVQVLLSCLPGT